MALIESLDELVRMAACCRRRPPPPCVAGWRLLVRRAAMPLPASRSFVVPSAPPIVRAASSADERPVVVALANVLDRMNALLAERGPPTSRRARAAGR